MLLPATVSSSVVEGKASKSIAKPEEVIGGMDNYKKYQMLV